MTAVARLNEPNSGAHAGHQLTGLVGLIDPETRVGYLACLTGSALLGLLRRCAQPTREGTPCRAFVRDDLGHDRCWSHGEGAGRTSTPRWMRRAG
jgi:hypothetical protein